MILLTDRGVLYGTLLCSDLPPGVPPATPAQWRGKLNDRTVGPDQSIPAVHDWLVRTGQRRLAVVDTANRLLGLLCLKSNQSGFCTTEGVAARERERRQNDGGFVRQPW